MKKTMFLSFFLFLAVPFLFSEDTSSAINQEETMMRVQEMINSRVFNQEFGVRKIWSVSSGLNDHFKENLFYRNRRIGGLAFLNIGLPSVGSLIAGDPLGGLFSLIGNGAGITLFIGGYMILNKNATYYPGYVETDTQTGISTLVMMLAGAGVVLLTDLFTIGRAIHLSNIYNTKLQDCLGMVSFNDNHFKNIDESIFLTTAPRTKDMVHFDLLDYRF